MGYIERFLRPCRKFTDIFPIAMIETFLLMMVGSLIGLVVNRSLGLDIDLTPEILEQLITGETELSDLTSLPAYLVCASNYTIFIGIWVAIILAMLLPPSNRPMLKKFLFAREGNTVGRALLGLLAGFGLNATCVVISILLGNIELRFDHFEPMPLLFLFVSVLVQSGAEEITCRQFLYQKLARRYRHPLVAAVLSAVFFGACHLGNIGMGPVPFAQVVIIGILFSELIYYYDALWACIMMHTAWNYTQNIIFGLPNSGLVSLYSIFELRAASSGPFFDAVFGVEGGIGACILLALSCVALFVYAKRHNLGPKDLWTDADQESEQSLPPVPGVPRHMA